ncbi:MAG: hypothetical protein ACTHLE_00885 [Agriterribacter sp.]
MNYLSKAGVQKSVASLLLGVMCIETILPVQALAMNGRSNTSFYYSKPYNPLVLPGASQPVNVNADYTTVKAVAPPLLEKKKTVDNIRQKLQQPTIGGPGQPEMSSFKSVNADNMVDLFTGDFSYNIPLLDVGGYPVNIHYNGGPTIDQEASWVGLGWNVNPGTVNRSMRGLPDDYNGTDTIKRIQRIKENKTVGVGVGGNLEIFGGALNLYINGGVFNNTYNGWGLEYGVNASLSAGKDSKGPLTASLGLNNNSQSGIDVSPGIGVRLSQHESLIQPSGSLSTNYNSRSGISGLQFGTQVSASIKSSLKDKEGNNRYISTGSRSVSSSSISFATPAYSPTIQMPFTSTNFSFNTKIGGEIWGAHPNFNISGYVSKQEIADEDTLQRLPGYGFLYYTNSTSDAHGLLDMNREKELFFNQKTTPHIAIPQYTYDAYSISGEGTGGMFRPYRSEAGYIRDHQLQTKSKSDHLAIDLGFGGYFKGGTDLNETIATTRNGAWKSEITPNLEFQKADTTFQPVYFRNPGEKTSNTLAYYHSVGGDSTVRIKLMSEDKNRKVTAVNQLMAYSPNLRDTRNIPVTGPLVKKQRDKRTQVITYKTAAEASSLGLDERIRSVTENHIPIGECGDTVSLPRVDEMRKAHHLSEITVLNADGRRYIYGLPAYNAEQQDVTFAISEETEQSKVNRGLADYDAGKDNNAATNNKGKDNFFSKDIMPPYAHSFLLTGLVSSDYVDITGDGITDDDLGDGVKFNYTMVYGKAPGKTFYQWRTPNEQNKVNYNEGLKTYSRDDKGTYMYGKKEVWYLNSVSSKTMIAVFTISDKREDGLGIIDENGGIDATQKLRRLERIDLYSKPDLVKNGANAKPVKSVHFEYDYSLCRNTINNTGNPVDKNGNTVASGSSSNVNKNKGKLTLRKIWFSYNGNYKGVKNPYVFNYGQVKEDQPADKYNPEHNSKHYDRWGGYKDPASNPAGLNNVDYPYVVQDSAKAADYANAWNLTDIRLPSGGLMKISYEADDYAYVQNKRAMQLFQLAGFGSSSTATPVKILYDGAVENEYIFINISEPVYSKSDIHRKYLEGVKKIFVKIAVQMPSDRWGGGKEFIPTWIEIEDYGVVANNEKRIWIKPARVDGKHPLIMAALQFLKLNIPSKAYPSSEMGDKLTFANLVTMLVSAIPEINKMVKGFYNAGKGLTWCKVTDPLQSFVRLNNPVYKKYGGGYRVKRVEVFDNWNTMTSQRGASYGQDYLYTTTQVITKDTVVAGVRKLKRDTLVVSSGVASYEPFIGGEENPLREPVEYEEKLSILAPKHYLYSEEPLGESFFPAASVGYSKVRVRTIHTKAKSANGWQETEFFTTRDFPTRVEHSPLDGDSKRPYNPPLRNLFKVNTIRNLTISQGFKVELNDMNGKMKGQANYAETDPDNPIHYTKNYYKVDDEKALAQHLNNTVWVVDSLNGSINRNGVIGLDIEMMTDMREQFSHTFSTNHQTNIDVIPAAIFPIPLIIPTYFPISHKEENTFRSTATVKIVQRYGILDSVVVVDKGSVVTTKNLVYDAETGDAVVSRTNNEFDDPVYQFNYPAHWAYSGMGPAYKNIDAVFTGKQFIEGKMTNADGSFFDVKRFFESGDEIILQNYRELSGITNVPGDCPKYNFGDLINVPKKIWVLDAAKAKEKHHGLYFIDENGKPYTAQINVGDGGSMRIIRSGKRNMLGAGVGNIVSLKNPVKEITAGRFKIVIDSTLDIINTAATAYKDLWQVEKSFYAKDSVVRVYKDFSGIELEGNVSTFVFDVVGTSDVRRREFILNSKFMTASLDVIRKDGRRKPARSITTKSQVQFDFSQIPSDAIITAAELQLTRKVPAGFLPQVTENSLKSYDWNTATEHYTGDSEAWFKQTILNIPGYYLTGSDNNLIEIVPGTYNYPCADLIQTYLSSPKVFHQGFVFELKKVNATNYDYSEHNYLSFCGDNKFYTDANTKYCVKDQWYKGNCECNVPKLVLSYRAYVDSVIHLCKENINDTATNPYRWGILGNWRADRAYTWYSDRKESDASTSATNIRVEGTLKAFTPFWQFSDSGLVNIADTNKWVWNAASSVYNKRGFEIENYDPLGRYNAGLYGYNQSLPVAVAQNSRYREVLFDGFEDYNYRNQACIPLCENPREFDFVKNQTGVSLDSTQSHTGNWSVKVNQGYQSLLTAPVTAIDSLPYGLSFKIDSVPIYDATRVIGAGTGFVGTYRQNAQLARDFGGCGTMADVSVTQTEMIANVQWGYITPIPGLCSYGPYEVQWSAKVQAKTTGWYTFYLKAIGGEVDFKVNYNYHRYNSATGEYEVTTFLTAGQLYPLIVDYYHIRTSEGFGLRLEWKESSINATGTREVIPTRFLYPPTTTSAPSNSFEYNIAGYCIKANNVKAERIIRPVFSPVAGKKIVISAWVRRDGVNCDVGPSPDNVLAVAFKEGLTQRPDSVLYPTGVRIESWQRYERIITVPNDATEIQLKLKGLSGEAIYVDDIRVQPYNSSMKSFAYDAVSLRLMAELDENNYASFYEYDNDGTLIRVKKETVKGIQTIKETRSALIKEQ